MPSKQTSLFYTKVRNFNDFISGFVEGGGGKALGTRLGLATCIEDVEAVVATADSL